MKKELFIIIISVLCVATGCSKSDDMSNSDEITTSISADYIGYDNVGDIVDASDLIFSGEVIGIRYEELDVRSAEGRDPSTGLEESEKIPYTIFEISVDQIYKGEVGNEEICVKRVGGEDDIIGDEATVIEEGKSYLFITQTFENSYPSMMNDTQVSVRFK